MPPKIRVCVFLKRGVDICLESWDAGMPPARFNLLGKLSIGLHFRWHDGSISGQGVLVVSHLSADPSRRDVHVYGRVLTNIFPAQHNTSTGIARNTCFKFSLILFIRKHKQCSCTQLTKCKMKQCACCWIFLANFKIFKRWTYVKIWNFTFRSKLIKS